MAFTRYAGNRFDGLEADTKPTNLPDGAKWTDLDGFKRTYIFISGVWEEYIGAAIDPANSIEIDGDNLQLVGDVASPGLNKTYGTDGAGVRGYKDDPAGAEWGSITGTLADQTDLNNALNLKANDNAVVKLTGDQTIEGIKTFNSSPIVPAPTTDMQAATKKYVDDNAGGGGIDAITTESAGANTTITTTNSAFHALTMTANLTATIADFNEAAKTHRFVLKVIQDGTGGRTLTIAGNVLFPAGIQPSNSESAGAVDLYEFVWDGTNWLLDNKTSAYA